MEIQKLSTCVIDIALCSAESRDAVNPEAHIYADRQRLLVT